MPRYIDADALLEELKSLQVTVTGIRCGKGFLSEIVREYQKSVLKIVNEQPTADVVPKSEVAREIFEEIERTCVDSFGCFYIGATHGAFAELKKKYTEATNE